MPSSVRRIPAGRLRDEVCGDHQPPAQRDIEAAFSYIKSFLTLHADRWLVGIEAAIESLASFPERCGVAPESSEFDVIIRQRLYGKRGGTYRILFAVQQKEVRVLHVRHGARQPLTKDELE